MGMYWDFPQSCPVDLSISAAGVDAREAQEESVWKVTDMVRTAQVLSNVHGWFGRQCDVTQGKEHAAALYGELVNGKKPCLFLVGH